MSSEFALVIGMALITICLRYAGFGFARVLDRYPRAKQGLASSGFCLMVSYLAIQIQAAPKLALPIVISIISSYVGRGILLPILFGWGAYIALLNFA